MQSVFPDCIDFETPGLLFCIPVMKPPVPSYHAIKIGAPVSQCHISDGYHKVYILTSECKLGVSGYQMKKEQWSE
jgi:hypothetical protein